MNLGFIILAHNQPAAIRSLTDMLANDGDRVVIHFDSSASAADQLAVQRIADEKPGQIRVISKVHCVWGEWSLVEAVLLALREFETMPNPPDYVHLMSGADYPLRPTSQLKEFLQLNRGLDFIECCDISVKPWVKDGMGKERFRYFFPFNFRTSRKAFYRQIRWQKKLKIRRKMPLGLKPHMGSQWWTLRWSTCRKVLEFISENPRVPRFFKSTWIPDESFFQTVIARLIPRGEIADLQLMFHHLTPSGRPYVFYNDHLPVIRRLPHFFIRKVSFEASVLRENLNKPEFHRKRIPGRKHLAKIRDLIRTRIDANHQFTFNVPGHPDGWYAPELKAEKRHLVLIFLTDHAQFPGVEEVVASNQAFCWLGRPFAPNSINTPERFLSNIGMGRAGWKIRDYFRQQFIHSLITHASEAGIPVAVVMTGEDLPDLDALNLLEGMLPLLVKTRSVKSLSACSLFLSSVHSSCPQFHDRLFMVDYENIPDMVRGLANDFPVSPPGGEIRTSMNSGCIPFNSSRVLP